MFDYDKDSGEIWIYDVIGPAWAGMVDAASVIDALKQMGGRDVTLRVSSPGGSVGEAVDMFNALQRYAGRVVAEIDSLAASAASFLVLAADEVKAAKNSRLMIHRAMTMTFGNINDHNKSIEMLSKGDETIAQMYADKTGKALAGVLVDMDAEKWFTAQEAKDYGLVDEIIGASDVVASVPDGMFATTPDELCVRPVPGTRTKYPLREAARIKNRQNRLLT